MPSIPQSLLWISLVVLWLFVLVPMLISKRDTVRRTSDVALATRVLNTGRGARLLKRRGPAAGHHSDPDWRPLRDDHDDFDGDDAQTAPRKAIVLAAATVETESEYLDVDVVEEDSGALPLGVSAMKAADDPVLPLDFSTGEDVVGASGEAEEPVGAVYEAGPPTAAIRTAADAEFEAAEALDEDVVEETVDDVAEDVVENVEDEPVDELREADDVEDATDEDLEYRAEGTDHDYETEDDSSGLEAVAESDSGDSMSHMRRDRFQTKTAAAVSARKIAFRKRMLMSMSALLLGSGVAAFLLSSTALWWVCGTVGAVTVLYLAYLRRQTRIEERLRRRRAQRMARSRLGVENTRDQEFDVVPSRLRRPGAVVLEIDDEDPIFEHLEYATYGEYHLPRAAGE